ncbi:YlbG family protein [Vagococcus humatus]|uniref:UPF0298 protein C7P63_08840 n=1 Tax=Vagococcus humatus TaxID=1889241 RepID=A0A3S0AB17_9ENTE|nr:YlbG family protein [Vagococcus humatus]RST88701.1 DUF2129 domain-containing protein [Vagococcus humatus]
MLDNQAEQLVFEHIPRRSLIVWVYSLKQVKNLRKYGFIYYVSRKMKYVVLYMEEASFEKNVEAIERLHFVRHTEKSHRPDLDMNFGENFKEMIRLSELETPETDFQELLDQGIEEDN